MPENVRAPSIEDHVIIKRPQCGNGPRDTPITSQEASNDQGIPRDQMSVDINWERLTTGPDGIALAEKIRSFVNERFQTVTLPRFIKQVSVHAFEFGSTAPQIEIKDICDPLPD